MISVWSSHKSVLTRLTLLWHLVIATVLFLSSKYPSFDSSATLVLGNGWWTSLLRWDVFHYAHIARNGYVYEHEYAFFPGTPMIMRIGARLLQSVGISTRSNLVGQLLGVTLASAAIAVDAIHTLYDLSMHHLRSPHAALLVSLLSLLSSSPATLRFAPYAEPFFTYLSYKGMLYCSRKHFLRASAVFTLASCFRSNGTMLAGYIVWGMIIEPVLTRPQPCPIIHPSRLVSKVVGCLLLSVLPILPFLWHQYNGYIQFCKSASSERRPWCDTRLPFIYSFVQSEYWDVGLFRYWTLQQAPNILIALPVLALLIYGSISHIRGSLLPMLLTFLRGDTLSVKMAATAEYQQDPFLDPSITPHAIQALIFGIILLTSAHTQIALRLVSALPFTYWAASRLFLPIPYLSKKVVRIDGVSRPDDASQSESTTEQTCRAAHWWIGWSMVWGTISLATWGAFLPPA